MIDERHLYEDAAQRFAPSMDLFERVAHRRDRKRRNQRIGALVLGLAITVGAIAAALSVSQRGTQEMPANPPITAGNVGDLALQWSAALGGDAPAPAVTDGVVTAATADGHVTAFVAGCATDGSACEPLWTADVGRFHTGLDRDDPVIKWWPGDPGEPNLAGGVGTVVGGSGVIYALTADGTLRAFDAHCRSDGGGCTPAWIAHLPAIPGAYPALPIVADAMVFIPSSRGVYAFDVGCGTGGAECTPRWYAPDPQVIRFQDGVIYGSDDRSGLMYAVDPATGEVLWSGGPGTCCGNDPIPVRFGDTVYMNFGQFFYAFPADCSGRCGPTWALHTTDAFQDGPVVVGDSVIMSIANDVAHGGFLSFPVDCASGGAICATSHRTWVSAELTSVPPVASGTLVFASSLRGGDVFAFDAGCLGTTGQCDPVWTANAFKPWQVVMESDVAFVADTDGFVSAYPVTCSDSPCTAIWQANPNPVNRPVVVDGTLYVTSSDHTLSAYAIGQATKTEVSKASAPFFYGGIVLIGLIAGVVVLIRRRRI